MDAPAMPGISLRCSLACKYNVINSYLIFQYSLESSQVYLNTVKNVKTSLDYTIHGRSCNAWNK